MLYVVKQCLHIFFLKNYPTILETGKVFESGDICAYLEYIHICEAFETHGYFQKIILGGKHNPLK